MITSHIPQNNMGGKTPQDACSEIILGMGSENGRPRYNVTLSFICCAQTHNDPCTPKFIKQPLKLINSLQQCYQVLIRTGSTALTDYVTEILLLYVPLYYNSLVFNQLVQQTMIVQQLPSV